MKSFLHGSYFRILLACFILVGILPTLLVGMVSQRIVKSTLGESAIRQTAGILARVKQDVDLMVEEYENVLETLSLDPDIQAMLLADRDGEFYAANYKLFLAIAGKGRLAAAHVVDVNYPVSISTATAPKSYQFPYNRNWRIFRKAEQSQSGIALKTGDKSATMLPGVVLTICRGVKDAEGNVIGYALIDVFDTALEDLIRNSASHYSSYFYAIDNLNYVVYSNDGMYYPTLARIPDALERVREDDTSSIEQDGFELLQHRGQELALIEVVAARGEMHLIMTVPMGAIVEDAAAVQTIVRTVILISLLLCIVVAYLVARGVSNPIRTLSQAMERVENGDYSVRVDFQRRDEIGVLGKNFNKMIVQIQALLDNIEEKQRRLDISESKALQAQINPHFLYNALDMIKWSAKMGKMDNASNIAVQLGTLFRNIARTKEDLVTVSFEMELVSSYLSIQKIRYGKRLSYRIDVPEEISRLRVPKLILQPIVENAVVHGLENRVEGGSIEIRGMIEDSYLVFNVEDNGTGIPADQVDRLNSSAQADGNSIGLANVDARAKLYGDSNCGVVVHSIEGRGTRVQLKLRLIGGENP